MEENIFAADNTDNGLKHADLADYADFQHTNHQVKVN